MHEPHELFDFYNPSWLNICESLLSLLHRDDVLKNVTRLETKVGSSFLFFSFRVNGSFTEDRLAGARTQSGALK
ncbi:hypothetical protein Y032_0315g2262 [Ancylostoma ceylanicum]|uniref:Uncharacterized protein n=1 Tax=Ancylostoma ceylanicum TaxID=53326 RepID=A0A016S1W1_9BILA|nr:hypothetical protein Y032_0315g2262 [Ancylostoma ceylanicum]